MKIIKQKDLATYRQRNKPDECPILGIPLKYSEAVVDHDHKTGLIRGVVHRQGNVLLGKIENVFRRYLAGHNLDIETTLLHLIDYLHDTPERDLVFHPSSIRLFCTRFRSRTAHDQRQILINSGIEPGSSVKIRLKQYRDFLKKSQFIQPKSCENP